MIVAVMLGAAIMSEAAPGQATVAGVLEAFRTLCLAPEAPLEGLGEAATARGYRSAPVESSPMTHVTAAWQRGGIVVFEREATNDPAWPLPAMCGVSADVGLVRNQRRLIHAIGGGVDAYAIAGAMGRRGASVTLLRDGRFVTLSVDRARRSHATVTILAHLEQNASE